MVTRKPVAASKPPNLRQPSLPYPVTPVSPSNARAESSKLPRPGHSDEFYPPNIHESQAFDSEPSNEVQKSPMNNLLDEDFEDPWADEFVDDADQELEPEPQRFPSVLKAGNNKLSQAQPVKVTDLPDVLRPRGPSDGKAPASSFGSHRVPSHVAGVEGPRESTFKRDGNKDYAARRGSREERDDSAFGTASLPLRTKQTAGNSSLNASDQWRDGQRSSAAALHDGQAQGGEGFGAPMPGNLQSKNPFRKPVRGSSFDPSSEESSASVWGDPPTSSQAKWKQEADEEESDGTPIRLSANLTREERPFSSFSTSYRPSDLDLSSKYRAQESNSVHLPPPSRAPPPPPPVPTTHPPPIPNFANHNTDQPDLIPVHSDSAQNPWPETQPSQDAAFSNNNSLPSNDSSNLHLNDDIINDVETMESRNLDRLESFPPLKPPRPSRSDNFPPPQPPRPSEVDAPPPPKPPRPTVVPSANPEAELTKLREKRNETYQIKHFGWFDSTTGRMRDTPMLIQNENGPCPLLALVNTLLLQHDSGSESSLAEALRTRDNITLGTLIESLISDEVARHAVDENLALPDLDELNNFLLMLSTGMNANPRFIPLSPAPTSLLDAPNSMHNQSSTINMEREPGTFEDTSHMRLYDTFSIPLVHGWLPKRGDAVRKAFIRNAQSYEDAQTVLCREEDLLDKLTTGLEESEQEMLEDVMLIKDFLDNNPTQLTTHGLGILHDSLFPSSFAILFRNDHFSTIYKHPESSQLFTLVTDLGYATRPEIIWESLVDINGHMNEFHSGDFRPVGNNEQGQSSSNEATSNAQGQRRMAIDGYDPPAGPPPGRTSSGGHLSIGGLGDPSLATPISPQERMVQEDEDFARALQMQEEENARHQSQAGNNNNNNDNNHRPRAQSQSLSQTHPQDQRSGVTGRPPLSPASTSDRRNRASLNNELRPSIPPRGSHRPAPPAVNRSAALQNDADAPPPAYEEATKDRLYNPPQSDGPSDVGGSSAAPGYGPGMGYRPRGGGGSGVSGGGAPMRRFQPQGPPPPPGALRNDRDCVVM